MFKIDSLKIKFPLNLNPVLNSKFKTMFTIYEDGEIIKEFKTKSYQINDGNSTVYYSIQSYNKIDYIIVLISSKTLGKNYFSGLKLNDIKDRLIKDNIAKYDFDTMIITDVDYCIDEYFSQEETKELFNELQKHFIPKNNGVGLSKTLNQYKGILTCSNRQKATNKNPFFKIYDKYKEAKNHVRFNGDNQNEFYINNEIEHLLYKWIDGVKYYRIRTEFTVKDKNHFKNLFNKNYNCYSWFNISQNEFSNAFYKILDKHFYFPEYKKLNIKARSYEHLIKHLLDNNDLNHTLVSEFLKNCTKNNLLSKDQKFRLESLIRRLMDSEEKLIFTRKYYDNYLRKLKIINNKIDENGK